jgi:hypothetical protein
MINRIEIRCEQTIPHGFNESNKRPLPLRQRAGEIAVEAHRRASILMHNLTGLRGRPSI